MYLRCARFVRAIAIPPPPPPGPFHSTLPRGPQLIVRALVGQQRCRTRPALQRRCRGTLGDCQRLSRFNTAAAAGRRCGAEHESARPASPRDPIAAFCQTPCAAAEATPSLRGMPPAQEAPAPPAERHSAVACPHAAARAIACGVSPSRRGSAALRLGDDAMPVRACSSDYPASAVRQHGSSAVRPDTDDSPIACGSSSQSPALRARTTGARRLAAGAAVRARRHASRSVRAVAGRQRGVVLQAGVGRSGAPCRVAGRTAIMRRRVTAARWRGRAQWRRRSRRPPISPPFFPRGGARPPSRRFL